MKSMNKGKTHSKKFENNVVKITNDKQKVSNEQLNCTTNTPVDKEGKEAIQILYTNCDGLSNKIDELNTRINLKKPEIVLICETKFDETIGNEGLPANYEIIRKDR